MIVVTGRSDSKGQSTPGIITQHSSGGRWIHHSTTSLPTPNTRSKQFDPNFSLEFDGHEQWEDADRYRCVPTGDVWRVQRTSIE
jgi:hypothetical protein